MADVALTIMVSEHTKKLVQAFVAAKGAKISKGLGKFVDDAFTQLEKEGEISLKKG